MLRPFNPSTDPTMTAFQAGQIVQDYIRKALPLFEPMEADYMSDTPRTLRLLQACLNAAKEIGHKEELAAASADAAATPLAVYLA